MSDHPLLLTFEWNRDDEVLEVHGNEEGFRNLGRIIGQLVQKGETEHCHLMTPDWGGESLSSDQQNPEAELINHVKLVFWPK